MPIEVVNFPFQGNDDKCLVLSNAQWAATGLGTAWTELWIGIRYCLEHHGAGFASPPPFFIGVMSNPQNDANGNLSNGWLSAATSHCVGITHANTGTSTLLDSATGRIYQFTSSNIFYPVLKVGSSSPVLGSSVGTGGYMGHTTFGARRFLLVVRLVKGSGTPYSMTINMLKPVTASSPSSWPVGTNMTLQAFLNVMIESTLNSAATLASTYESVSGAYIATITASVSGINETTNGPLNAIHVAWGRVTPRLAISDICYVIKS
jgi:hypothetical protein